MRGKRIFALQQSHDPDGAAIEVALYNESFTKTMMVVVSREGLALMKTRPRYVWTCWARIPREHIVSQVVKTEEELFS